MSKLIITVPLAPRVCLSMHVTEGLLLSLLLLTASTLQISQLSGTLGEDVQLVCTQVAKGLRTVF